MAAGDGQKNRTEKTPKFYSFKINQGARNVTRVVESLPSKYAQEGPAFIPSTKKSNLV